MPAHLMRCVAVATLCLAGPAVAQERMTIIAGFSAGGTYDATARLFARHLARLFGLSSTVVERAKAIIK
jgi:tripartite-type tricarboxylate transporter receptor subunit TctC